MRAVTIDDLTRVNRPPQFAMLEFLTREFAASPAVTHLLVRGSIASGTADRLSDIDFVIGVAEDRFAGFVRALDTLMAVTASAILPGWRDTIVRRMGGVGFVYLAVSEERLVQVDIYVVPAQLVPDIVRNTGSSLLYGHLDDRQPAGPPVSPLTARLVSDHHEKPLASEDLIVESLVLVMMMEKRIKRGEQFIVYAETYQLLTAVKDLIKTSLAPASTAWGWYGLQEDLGLGESGRRCLAALAAMTESPPVSTVAELAALYRQVEEIAKVAAPESMASLASAVAAYEHYLGLS